MSKRCFRISACVVAAALAALIWANVSLDRRQTWDVCYEMANRRIEWTGAGYAGK